MGTTRDGEEDSLEETAEEILAELWPLHAAARDGDAARVAQILEGGADPTERDGGGRTAYMLARERGARDALKNGKQNNTPTLRRRHGCP